MDKLNVITNHFKKNSNESLFDEKNSNIKIIPSDKSNYEEIGRNINSISGNKNDPYNHTIVNELIPYPISLISTIIQKGDDDHYAKKTLVKFKKHTLLNNQLNNINPSSHGTTEESIVNITSQNNQIQDICFDKLDISQIVKRLKERTDSSTQTDFNGKCNQYIQVNILDNPDRVEHQRSNHALRNQLHQLNYIIEEMSKEKSNHNIYIHQLQKQISSQELKIKEIQIEKEKLLTEKEELKSVVQNSKSRIDASQEILTGNESFKRKSHLASEIVNLMNQKDNIINDLNKRIRTFEQENIRLNNVLGFLNEKLQSIETVNKKGQNFFFLNALKIIKDECKKLNEQLNLLKIQYLKNLNDIVNYYPSKIEEISRLSLVNYCQYCEQLKLEIIKIKKINEQLTQEKLHEKDRNIQINYEFQACLSHLRGENEHLKETNTNLESKVQSMKDDLSKLHREYRNFNECEASLQKENTELKDLLVRLKENDSYLKSKYEQLTQDNDKNDVDREYLNFEINKLKDQINLDQNEKEQYRHEIDVLKKDIAIKNDEIINLQSLTEKYQKMVNLNEGKSISAGNQLLFEDMKHVLSQKDILLTEQNVQIENLRNKIVEYENKITSSLQVINEKEIQIEQLNRVLDQNNQIDQRSYMLELELAKEKERSKGLSLSLIKEKRYNSQLIEELSRTKKSLEKSLDNSKQEQNNKNVEKLKQELIQRIKQLKKLINQSEIDENIHKLNSDEPNSLSRNYLSSDLLIQMLNQSEEMEYLNAQKPLTKIHSSVENLRQEFNNLKMTFLQTYNNNENIE